MAIKLVGIDLDDTLLNPDRTISSVNRLTVIRTINAGVMVVLASGRTIQSMRPYAETLGMVGKRFPMICFNGAEIRDIDTRSIIHRRAFTQQQTKLCIGAILEAGLPAQVYEDEGIIVTEQNKWTDRDTSLTGLPNRLPRYNGEMWAEERSKVLASGDPDAIQRVLPALREKLAGTANLLLSKPYFLEVLPIGADKGDALAWVANKYGIHREETMAIGDSWNDLGMIRWAGAGCAPADAQQDVLAAARHVAEATHDNGAVAELLKRFILDIL